MKPKGVPALIPFLIAIFVLFIGILIWAYVETKKANPQMIQVGQAFRPAAALLRGAPPQRAAAAPKGCPTRA